MSAHAGSGEKSSRRIGPASVPGVLPSSPARPATSKALDAALWVLAVLSAVATFWYSLGPTPPGVPEFTGADKVFHGLAYGTTLVLVLLAAVWRPGRGPGRYPRVAPLVVIGAIATGGAVELLQGLTPAREPELWDWIAEILGAAAAAGAVGLLRVLMPSTSPAPPSKTT